MRFSPSALAVAGVITLGLSLSPQSSQAQTASFATSQASTSGLNTATGLSNAASPTYITNDGLTYVVFKGGVVDTTATIRTQATTMRQAGYGSATLTDQVVSLPSGTVVIAGPFPVGRWNNTQYGTLRVDFTSITTVSVTAQSLAQ